MKLIKFPSKEFEKLCERKCYRKKRVEDKVRRIIEDVRLSGDEAITKYTKKFDKVKLLPRQFKVSESETNGAYQNIDTKFYGREFRIFHLSVSPSCCEVD